MKTIEDKLQAAHELGRIVGAAECFADEDVRNTVCGAAHALFDGLLTEAWEEVKASRKKTASLIRLAQNYPPDPFDFVETGEMVEKDINVPSKKTNFDRITESPEVLARNLAENVYECPRGGCPYDDRHDPSKEDCVRCLTDWLNEEAEDK